MQVNVSPPEMDVIREMEFLKMHDAARRDGLSSSFFKAGREVVGTGVNRRLDKFIRRVIGLHFETIKDPV